MNRARLLGASILVVGIVIVGITAPWIMGLALIAYGAFLIADNQKP